MKKILWFSRHAATPEQLETLKKGLNSDIEITIVNGTMPNVHVPFKGFSTHEGVETPIETEFKPFKEMVKDFDLVHLVAPTNILEQVLGVVGTVPVIISQMKRILDSEGKNTQVVFEKFTRVKKITIETEDF